jgi:hypothetical protein
MRLKAKYPTESLTPPLDILCVWLAHLIRNESYSSYCKEIQRREADECNIPLTLNEEDYSKVGRKGILREVYLTFSFQKTAELYETEYNEPILLDTASVSSFLNTSTTATSSKHLPTALDLLRDRDWLHLDNGILLRVQKSVSDEQLSKCIREARRSYFFPCALYSTFFFQYSQFLYLKAKYPSLSLPATSLVDLMWHAHLLHAREYRSDCVDLLGFHLLHDPWPDTSEELDKKAFDEECDIWRTEFNMAPWLDF